LSNKGIVSYQLNLALVRLIHRLNNLGLGISHDGWLVN